MATFEQTFKHRVNEILQDYEYLTYPIGEAFWSIFEQDDGFMGRHSLVTNFSTHRKKMNAFLAISRMIRFEHDLALSRHERDIERLGICIAEVVLHVKDFTAIENLHKSFQESLKDLNCWLAADIKHYSSMLSYVKNTLETLGQKIHLVMEDLRRFLSYGSVDIASSCDSGYLIAEIDEYLTTHKVPNYNSDEDLDIDDGIIYSKNANDDEVDPMLIGNIEIARSNLVTLCKHMRELHTACFNTYAELDTEDSDDYEDLATILCAAQLWPYNINALQSDHEDTEEDDE
jgi:hypothetical protein